MKISMTTRKGGATPRTTKRSGKPRHSYGVAVGSEAPDWPSHCAPPANPMALDPYNPVLPRCATKRNEADPLALDPYSPIRPTRTRLV